MKNQLKIYMEYLEVLNPKIIPLIVDIAKVVEVIN